MTIEEKVKEDLRILALTDFDAFLKKVNVDLTTLVICERRKRDKSIRQIAAAMQMPRSTVHDLCQHCP